jgi:HEPN domain-containing protein
VSVGRTRRVTVNVKYIFDAARDFRIGSGMLAERFGPGVFPLRTTVVTSAFSVELYLKCLLLLTTGKVPKLHKLAELHDALLPETKDLANAKYHAIAPHSGQLRDALAEHNDTFVEWRYLFERQDKPFTLNYRSLLDAATCLHETTVSLRTEWAET